MTTYDIIPDRRTARLDILSIGPTIAAILLLALGAVALSAPPTPVSDDWHGNVAASTAR